MTDMDTAGVTGVYLSSEGKKGKDVWGTRGALDDARGQGGRQAGHDRRSSITRAIPVIPTYWHARGYGLFAANTLGQGAFTDGKQQLNFALPAGRVSSSATA